MEGEKKAVYGANIAAAMLALQFLIWKSLSLLCLATSWFMGNTDISNSMLMDIETALTAVISVVLPSVLFFAIRGKSAKEHMNIKAELQVTPVFITMFTVAITLLFIYVFDTLDFPGLPNIVYKIPNETGNMLLSFFLRTMLIPILSELFFRGIILVEFLPFGRGAAIAVSAFTSAAISYNLSEFIYLFVFGVVCSFFVYRTGSVWTGVFIHILCELTVFIASFIHSRGIYEMHTPLLHIISIAVCIMGAVSIVLVNERLKRAGVKAIPYERNRLSILKGIFTPCAFAYYLLIILYY